MGLPEILKLTRRFTVGAYTAQYATDTWPRETFPPLFLGSITSAVGITVLAWATHEGTTSTILGMMALTGPAPGCG